MACSTLKSIRISVLPNICMETFFFLHRGMHQTTIKGSASQREKWKSKAGDNPENPIISLFMFNRTKCVYRAHSRKWSTISERESRTLCGEAEVRLLCCILKPESGGYSSLLHIESLLLKLNYTVPLTERHVHRYPTGIMRYLSHFATSLTWETFLNSSFGTGWSCWPCNVSSTRSNQLSWNGLRQYHYSLSVQNINIISIRN